MNPLLLVDSYKVHHTKMYPEGMTKLYSNFTPRKSRIAGIDKVVVFGIQHFIIKYLIEAFNKDFFGTSRVFFNGETDRQLFKKVVIDEYKRHCPVDTTHIEALWNLGYLPIEVKSLEEGSLCPIGVPILTITNTHPEFAWLVNYLETLISCMMWQPITSATISYEYKKLLSKYAKETTGSDEFVQWQGHDFSMRGMSSVESAILSGMGHLLNFTGTDTIPAIYSLEQSYSAKGLIGASVPATEHSVMCMGTKESEIETFKRLLDLYPTGILSVVSDTWDLWKVCTEYLPALKEEILARDGKLVIRPDSGDPVDIICGNKKMGIWQNFQHYTNIESKNTLKNIYESKGVIELLWDTFGGSINEQGYKVLDLHIGAIYGDSITLERAEQICERLKTKGFASTNIVLGIGSYTYQYNTRDTFGFAMKATYGEITHPEVFEDNEDGIAGGWYRWKNNEVGNPEYISEEEYKLAKATQGIEPREIFKDPITDDGTKKSKKGLLQVFNNNIIQHPTIQEFNSNDKLALNDQCTWEQERGGLLQTVFKDGKLVRTTSLEEIREKLKSNL